MAIKKVTLMDSDGNTLYPNVDIQLGTPIVKNNSGAITLKISTNGGLQVGSDEGLKIHLSTKDIDGNFGYAGFEIDENGGLLPKLGSDNVIYLSTIGEIRLNTKGVLNQSNGSLTVSMGKGITNQGSGLTIKLGSGLVFDADGKLCVNLGSTLKFDGNNNYKIEVDQ